jgi:hypothetical protein
MMRQNYSELKYEPTSAVTLSIVICHVILTESSQDVISASPFFSAVCDGGGAFIHVPLFGYAPDSSNKTLKSSDIPVDTLMTKSEASEKVYPSCHVHALLSDV